MSEENNNTYLLPRKLTNKKTLVLDLDETLVHSQFTEFAYQSDIIIKIEIKNEVYNIHVLVRPGVKEFLEKMEKCYEIVIFTASISNYADLLLDIIDPENCCPFRLFREHCTIVNSTFVKDLQKLGRELKDVVIVDNSPLSYMFHPNNGLPILSWFDDKEDRELYNITPILEFLSNVYDVRDYIPKMVIDNEISYPNAMKVINTQLNYKKINNNIKYHKKIINNADVNNNINNSNKFYELNNNGELSDKMNKKEYEINIQIVQNNINNIMNETQKQKMRNQLNQNYTNKKSNSKNKNKVKYKKRVTPDKLIEYTKSEILYNLNNPFNLSLKHQNNSTKQNNNNNVITKMYVTKVQPSKERSQNSYFTNIDISKLKSNLENYVKNAETQSTRNPKKSMNFIGLNNYKNIKDNNNNVYPKRASNSVHSKRRVNNRYINVPNTANISDSKNKNNINQISKTSLNQTNPKIQIRKTKTKKSKLVVILESDSLKNQSIRDKKQIESKKIQFTQSLLNNKKFKQCEKKKTDVILTNKNIQNSIKCNDSNQNSMTEHNSLLTFFKKEQVPGHRRIRSQNDYSFFKSIQKCMVKPPETKSKLVTNKKNVLLKKSSIHSKNSKLYGINSECRSIFNNMGEYRTNRQKHNFIKANKINETDINNGIDNFRGGSDYTYKNRNDYLKDKNSTSSFNNNKKIKGHRKTLSFNFDCCLTSGICQKFPLKLRNNFKNNSNRNSGQKINNGISEMTNAITIKG